MARYDITNYAGETLFTTWYEDTAREWLRGNGIKGDTLWDNYTDEPMETV